MNRKEEKKSVMEFRSWLEGSRYRAALRDDFFDKEEVDSSIEWFFDENHLEREVRFDR